MNKADPYDHLPQTIFEIGYRLVQRWKELGLQSILIEINESEPAVAAATLYQAFYNHIGQTELQDFVNRLYDNFNE